MTQHGREMDRRIWRRLTSGHGPMVDRLVQVELQLLFLPNNVKPVHKWNNNVLYLLV